MRYCIISIATVFFYILFASRLCFGMIKGEIYNLEAQNIVNTADLILKAEHAYFQNSGGFTDITGLESSSPAYLSPMQVYNFNGETCINKILFRNIMNICVNLQKEMLEVYIPSNLFYSDAVSREISKGITGKTGQVSYIDGLWVIAFNLDGNPPSFASNPGSAPPISSTLTSPDANGGMNYTDTAGTQTSLLGKGIQAIIGFFTSIISLF